MKALNKETAPKAQRPERIIQFGEGNFLRAFVDWIIYNMNQKTDFNSNVVVVQPIDKGMVDMLNAQDDLYHVNLQGLDKGETINSLTMIDVISRALNPYTQNDEFMKLAEQPEMRFVISNTTEAGIAFDPACKLTDTPASSYPGKLTQLLYHRFKTFSPALSAGNSSATSCGASMTHKWKISACTTKLSSYCIFSFIAAMSLRGNPGTIRSTSVAYTPQASSNQVLNSSPNCHNSMY